MVIGSLTDAAFETLDLRDFSRLLGGRHVLVDDAEAPLLRDGNGEARLGHRVHRRRDERNVERDRAGEAGLQGNVARDDERVGGD
jgi:hypothetical protein